MNINEPTYLAEPFRIKAIEHLKTTDRAYREKALAGTGYNLFNLPAEDVYIDLLTDSAIHRCVQVCRKLLFHQNEGERIRKQEREGDR